MADKKSGLSLNDLIKGKKKEPSWTDKVWSGWDTSSRPFDPLTYAYKAAKDFAEDERTMPMLKAIAEDPVSALGAAMMPQSALDRAQNRQQEYKDLGIDTEEQGLYRPTIEGPMEVVETAGNVASVLFPAGTVAGSAVAGTSGGLAGFVAEMATPEPGDIAKMAKYAKKAPQAAKWVSRVIDQFKERQVEDVSRGIKRVEDELVKLAEQEGEILNTWNAMRDKLTRMKEHTPFDKPGDPMRAPDPDKAWDFQRQTDAVADKWRDLKSYKNQRESTLEGMKNYLKGTRPDPAAESFEKSLRHAGETIFAGDTAEQKALRDLFEKDLPKVEAIDVMDPDRPAFHKAINKGTRGQVVIKPEERITPRAAASTEWHEGFGHQLTQMAIQFPEHPGSKVVKKLMGIAQSTWRRLGDVRSQEASINARLREADLEPTPANIEMMRKRHLADWSQEQPIGPRIGGGLGETPHGVDEPFASLMGAMSDVHQRDLLYDELPPHEFEDLQKIFPNLFPEGTYPKQKPWNDEMVQLWEDRKMAHMRQSLDPQFDKPFHLHGSSIDPYYQAVKGTQGEKPIVSGWYGDQMPQYMERAASGKDPKWSWEAMWDVFTDNPPSQWKRGAKAIDDVPDDFLEAVGVPKAKKGTYLEGEEQMKDFDDMMRRSAADQGLEYSEPPRLSADDVSLADRLHEAGMARQELQFDPHSFVGQVIPLFENARTAGELNDMIRQSDLADIGAMMDEYGVTNDMAVRVQAYLRDMLDTLPEV
jgi:hypothetical protein